MKRSEEAKLLEQIEQWNDADDDILGHVKKHIDQYFGTFTQILSVDGNPDLPIQIVLIPPRLEHDYYTLVTLGLSRHRMKFPEALKQSWIKWKQTLPGFLISCGIPAPA